jgi:hypothetical protein
MVLALTRQSFLDAAITPAGSLRALISFQQNASMGEFARRCFSDRDHVRQLPTLFNGQFHDRLFHWESP